PPAQAASEATAWLARGFTTAKIKVAGPGEIGLERVAAVRAAVGSRMALRVDFNESLTPAEAVPFIRALEGYALTLVEQPGARAPPRVRGRRAAQDGRRCRRRSRRPRTRCLEAARRPGSRRERGPAHARPLPSKTSIRNARDVDLLHDDPAAVLDDRDVELGR